MLHHTEEILLHPHGLLESRSSEVEMPSREIEDLGAALIETSIAAGGLGLSAPQIGVSKRVIAITVPNYPPFWLVNPVIEERLGVRSVMEGCLSLPDEEPAAVVRSVRVKVRSTLGGGEPHHMELDGLLAQVLEHEVDHIDGRLYIDRVGEWRSGSASALGAGGRRFDACLSDQQRQGDMQFALAV